jgi:hypothetical protein
MNFFDHKDLGNHLLQLCLKVVKHPVYTEDIDSIKVTQGSGQRWALVNNNEPSDCVKSGRFLENLSHQQFLKDSVTWPKLSS